jgi:asparaginyl-tRNA synthetase
MWLSDGRPAAAVDVRVAATGEIIAGGKREVRIEVLRRMVERGPTFRGENSNTSRHLAEFWMIEPEIAFADLSDNAALAEALLKYTFVALLNEREQDLAFFDQRIEKGLLAKLEGIVGSEFVHMDYGEAIQVLERCEREIQVPGQMGRRPAVGARALSDREIREEAGPRGELPEGHQSLLHAGNDDGRTVAAMDVLAPGIGEIIGGSQREERLEGHRQLGGPCRACVEAWG